MRRTESINEETFDYLKSVIIIFSNLKFRYIICMAFFSYSFGSFLASNYKLVGIENNLDDKFMTIAGSFGSFCNFLSVIL